MQITISKQTAKAARQVMLVFAHSIQEKKPDGTIDHEKLKATLKSCGLTSKDYYRISELVEKLDKKLK